MAWVDPAGGLPAHITFDPSTKVFTIQTTDCSLVGTTATIRVLGYLKTGYSAQATFNINFISCCSTSTINNSGTYPKSISYTFGTASQTESVNVFSTSCTCLDGCAFDYNCVSDTGAVLTSNVFTYTAGNDNFQYQTSNVADAGTYLVDCTADLKKGGTSYNTKTLRITLYVTDCATAVPFTKFNPGATTYYVKQGTATNTFTAWQTVNTPSCDSFLSFTA